MFISGVGTATPVRSYTQQQCWEAIQRSSQYERLGLRARSILKKVLHCDNGIQSRFLALDHLEEAFQLNPDALQARFLQHAPQVAAEAGARALEAARLRPEQVDALLVSTCTGYLCPGLTSYVSERLGLRTDALCLDLVGQGCGAALPNLRTAEALVGSGRAERVLSVCVEICSAAFYLDDDPGVLISACLFGDGAAAAVCTREPLPHARRVRWRGAETLLSAIERDLLRFEQRQGMLRNILDLQVPGIAARHAESVLQRALEKHQLTRKQITQWIWHAGGRDVLAALCERLQLRDEEVVRSAAVLRQHGNVSSPFVLFVLERALQENAPGGWWWLASFGAGFSSHGAILEVE